MTMHTSRGRYIATLLQEAAGVSIGTTDSCDIQVKNEDFLAKALAGGDLAIGEGFMDGEWWFNGDGVDILYRIFTSGIDKKLRNNKAKLVLSYFVSLIANPQSVLRSWQVGKEHYDLPPIIFRKMLGGHNDYSCLRWPEGITSIGQAQRVKYQEIAAKLKLEEGMRVCDIGCGRGGLARYLAETAKVEVVGLTVSQGQADAGIEHCKGYPVKFVVQPYQELRPAEIGPFDRIVSVGMFEHVGRRNNDHFMRLVYECLSERDIFVLHSIVGNGHSPWLDTYIFPGGDLQRAYNVQRAAYRYFGEAEEWENFGWDYYLTLTAWLRNFIKHWDEIRAACGDELAARYGSAERFYRMWVFYLSTCAARFKARLINVGQWVFVKGGTQGVYETSRPYLQAA